MNVVGVRFIKQGTAPCELLLTSYRITTDHGSIFINKREIWLTLILNKMEAKVQSPNFKSGTPPQIGFTRKAEAAPPIQV